MAIGEKRRNFLRKLIEGMFGHRVGYFLVRLIYRDVTGCKKEKRNRKGETI